MDNKVTQRAIKQILDTLYTLEDMILELEKEVISLSVKKES